MAIREGTLVRVGGATVHITTVDPQGRTHKRDKFVPADRPIFGEVRGVYEVKPAEAKNDGFYKPAEHVALVRWAGPRYRTSVLPVEKLQPANTPFPSPQPPPEGKS